MKIKYILTACLILVSIISNGQNFKSLNEIKRNDTIPSGQAIIYGNFIQRLGFSSGGYPQDIRIINVDTQEIFAFRVKPTFKSAKENMFCYSLNAGTYAVLNYWWTQSKWYGGKMFTEPIFKGIDATENLAKRINTGRINPNELERFIFTVEGNSINYLGTWHFNTGLVSFTDDKDQFDNLLKGSYKRLDFSSAATILPD